MKTHLVFEQLQEPTDDDYDEEATEWVPFYRTSGEISELNGRELVNAQQVNENVTGKIEIRRFDGITSEMRVRDLKEDEVWNIAAITKTERNMTLMVSR